MLSQKGQKICSIIILVALVFNLAGCEGCNGVFRPTPISITISPLPDEQADKQLAQILGPPQLTHKSHYYPIKVPYTDDVVKSVFGMELGQGPHSTLGMTSEGLLSPSVDMTDLASIGAFIESLRKEHSHIIGEWKIPGITPPGMEDLTETIDIRITPRIQALAAQLHYDPKKIFLYVRNNMDYEPYFRSWKGSEGTLIERAGNSTDLSSLLIALLRASGIYSRYVVGVVSLPIESVMNWVGVQCPDTAYHVLVKNGIPAWKVTIAGKDFVFMMHDWVEALIPPFDNPFGIKVWVPMDPSFKQYDYFDGIDIAQASKFNPDTFLAGAKEGAIINEPESYFTGLNRPFIEGKLDWYARNLWDYVQMHMPGATVGDVTGYRKIREVTKITPPPLPFLPLRAISEMTPPAFLPEIPWRYSVRLTLGGIDYQAYTPEITGKRIGIYYEVVTFRDGEVRTVRPKLLLEDKVVAVGDPIYIGDWHLLTMTFYDVWGTDVGSATKHLTAGSHYTIVLNLQRMAINFMEERIEKFEREIAGLPPDEPLPVEAILEILHIIGVGWSMKTDVMADLYAQIDGIVWTRHPSVAVTEWDALIAYLDRERYPVREGGANIDVIRSIVNPFSVVGDLEDVREWMVSVGTTGSALEHLIFEQTLQAPSVSTMEILTFASDNFIPVYSIDETNVYEILPKLDTWGGVKQHIYDAVKKGWVASIPQRNVQLGRWYGIGWIIMDPQTGAAGYLIAGSRIGGPMTTGGGATQDPVEWWREVVADFIERARRLWRAGDDISTGATLIAGGDILLTALKKKGVVVVIGVAGVAALKVGGKAAIVVGVCLVVRGLWRFWEVPR